MADCSDIHAGLSSGDPEDAPAGLLLAVLRRQGEQGSRKNQQGSVNTLWAVKGSVGLSGEAAHSPGALALWAAGRSGQGGGRGGGAALVILTVQSVTEGIFTLRYLKFFF